MTMALVLAAIFVAACIACPREQRRPMIVSGLLSAPFSLSSFDFDPAYWHPLRIIDFPFSPEDFLFSFTTGGLAWFLVVSLVRADITLNIDIRTILKRYILIVLHGSIVYSCVRLAGIDVMSAALIAIASVLVHTVWLRRDLWFIPGIGMIGFTVLYTTFLKVVFLAFPAFHQQWTVTTIWGTLLWEMPLGEVAWAVMFGSTWSLVIAYLFDAQIGSRNNATIRSLRGRSLCCRGEN
jgi:hypothetical protein